MDVGGVISRCDVWICGVQGVRLVLKERAMRGSTVALAIVTCVICCFFVGGCCWSYTLNFWFDHLETDYNIGYWWSCVVGIIPIIGQLGIPGWLITHVFETVTS